MTHPHWYLPASWVPSFVAALGGPIDLDPCAARPELDNIHASTSYVYPEQDGLGLPWLGRVYVNSPYDRKGVRDFADKTIRELPNVVALAALVPLRPSARWWRDLARAMEVCILLPRRIGFIDGTGVTRGMTGRDELCVFGWRLADPDALGGIVVKNIMSRAAVREKPQRLLLPGVVAQLRKNRARAVTCIREEIDAADADAFERAAMFEREAAALDLYNRAEAPARDHAHANHSVEACPLHYKARHDPPDFTTVQPREGVWRIESRTWSLLGTNAHTTDWEEVPWGTQADARAAAWEKHDRRLLLLGREGRRSKRGSRGVSHLEQVQR